MKRTILYEVKRRKIIYRIEMDFNSKIHEIIWRIAMRLKGNIVKPIKKD